MSGKRKQKRETKSVSWLKEANTAPYKILEIKGTLRSLSNDTLRDYCKLRDIFM